MYPVPFCYVPDSWEKEQMPACNRRVAADYRSRGWPLARKKDGGQKRATGCEIGCVVVWTTRGNAGHSQDPRSLADCAGAFGRGRGDEGKKTRTRCGSLGPVLGICYRHQ